MLNSQKGFLVFQKSIEVIYSNFNKYSFDCLCISYVLNNYMYPIKVLNFGLAFCVLFGECFSSINGQAMQSVSWIWV